MALRDRPGSARARTRALRLGHASAGTLSAALLALGAQSCSAVVDTGTKACTTHSQCQRRFDETTFCRYDGVCAPLFSDECTELYWFGESDAVTRDSGNLPDSNTVILGFMGPGNKLEPGSDEAYAEPLRTAAREAVKSIQRVYPNNVPQALALLDCDDTGDNAVKVFQHLAQNVRVPAIVGPVFSSTTLKLIDSLDRMGDTMLLSPSATAINFSSEVSPRLWRTVPPDTYQVDALIALYKKLVADQPGRSFKLHVVACEQAGWCDSFRSTLIGELQRADIAYTATSYEKNDETKAVLQGELAATLKRDKPDVVIGVGIGELGQYLLPALESQPDAITPIYLFPEAERFDGLAAAVRMHPAIAGRVLGTAPGPRIPQAGECGGDLGTFLDQVTAGNLGEFGYDAAFLLAYALSSMPEAHPDGLRLAERLSRLSCKDGGAKELRADTQQYPGSAKMLGQNPDTCADYCGVSGPLDFPSGALSSGENREAPSDIGFWCPSVAPNGDVSFKVPPGDFGTGGSSDKPYYAVTTTPQGIKGAGQLRFCRAATALDAGVEAGAATSDAGAMDAGSDAGAAPDAAAPKDAALDASPDAAPSDARTDDAQRG
jgi:ABC-type branched-subunit amino acid transport system substrate-binding protein